MTLLSQIETSVVWNENNSQKVDKLKVDLFSLLTLSEKIFDVSIIDELISLILNSNLTPLIKLNEMNSVLGIVDKNTLLKEYVRNIIGGLDNLAQDICDEFLTYVKENCNGNNTKIFDPVRFNLFVSANRLFPAGSTAYSVFVSVRSMILQEYSEYIPSYYFTVDGKLIS